MVETDHAFDKHNHVETDRGVVEPGVSPETLVADGGLWVRTALCRARGAAGRWQ